VGLYDLVNRLHAAGDALSAGSADLAALDPGARPLGGDAPGCLGALGRTLHVGIVAGLAARGAEAAAHGARLADAAAALHQVADRYADGDLASGRRLADGAP
jgi:hypothetical protein